jgi:hypothetical protein
LPSGNIEKNRFVGIFQGEEVIVGDRRYYPQTSLLGKK